MDIIRTLIIVFLAGMAAVFFALITGLWPLAIILGLTLAFLGIYLQPKADQKWAQIKKKYFKDKKFEVLEVSDQSNIPGVEFPDDAEIKEYEEETGRRVGVVQRAKMKKTRPGQDVDEIILQYMEVFKIDKKRASILYSNGYTSIHDFENATVEDLAGLEGVSPTVARKVVARMKAA